MKLKITSMLLLCLILLLGNAFELGAEKQSADNLFVGDEKEWMVGNSDTTWTDGQIWISGLGNGWRTPDHKELQRLWEEVGSDSILGSQRVWAEKEESGMIWQVNFKMGGAGAINVDDRLDRAAVVAVRDR